MPKTLTAKEKTIIKLMEMVIDELSTCNTVTDPAFDMYYIMHQAVDREVYYPLHDREFI
tara:strand:+ start:206 stop:382 length:177 start_codon:yes stop_codon:yes gene_type:complete